VVNLTEVMQRGGIVIYLRNVYKRNLGDIMICVKELKQCNIKSHNFPNTIFSFQKNLPLLFYRYIKMDWHFNKKSTKIQV